MDAARPMTTTTDATAPAHSGDQPPFGAFAPGAALRAILSVTQAMPASRPGRLVAHAMRRLGIRLMKNRPADVEALGARLRLHPFRNVCEKRVLFTPQYFDPREREILASRIAAKQDGFVFVDIGANVGAYALFVAAQAGSGARVLAIEPQPAIFERLVTNIRLNPFGTVKAVDCAVADKSGEVTLFLDPSNQGESSVKIIGSSRATPVKVQARTLLELLQDEGFGHVDAVKLDVEGAEDLILEPFLREAPRELLPRLLILEDGSGRWQVDLVKLLQDNGYRLTERTRLNFILERD
jgi:FkbM family methyltransferase